MPNNPFPTTPGLPIIVFQDQLFGAIMAAGEPLKIVETFKVADPVVVIVVEGGR